VKCTNKIKAGVVSCLLILSLTLFGCGSLAYSFPYDRSSLVSGFKAVDQISTGKATPYAANLCVVSENKLDNNINMGETCSACLFDVSNNSCLYSLNAHEKVNPASLTKIMTALVAVKYGSLDQVLTATGNIKITETGAQTMDLKAGDTMTLDQALHILLIHSDNDVAMLVAENIGGTIDAFIGLMNDEAKRIGATNTHFVNPHGLTEEEHYTTAYDMYLIFNEAIKYEAITQILNLSNYETSYNQSGGFPKEVSYRSTNLFLRGEKKAPNNVTVIGGKTGTTLAAGHCLILLSKNTEGKPFISVIMKAPSTETLYDQMITLLELIP
jgi:D-alanyl-D-alanine carboxypeptidase